MDDKEKHQSPHVLGNDPFADMDTLEWLGIESPPTPARANTHTMPPPAAAEPEQAHSTPATKVITPEETNSTPETAQTILDDAERALQEWLGEETPPEIPPTEATPMAEIDPVAQTELLSWLFSEQQHFRENS
jgi:hypothetical protein